MNERWWESSCLYNAWHRKVSLSGSSLPLTGLAPTLASFVECNLVHQILAGAPYDYARDSRCFAVCEDRGPRITVAAHAWWSRTGSHHAAIVEAARRPVYTRLLRSPLQRPVERSGGNDDVGEPDRGCRGAASDARLRQGGRSSATRLAVTSRSSMRFGTRRVYRSCS
jgi:hypothetical protein